MLSGACYFSVCDDGEAKEVRDPEKCAEREHCEGCTCADTNTIPGTLYSASAADLSLFRRPTCDFFRFLPRAHGMHIQACRGLGGEG